MIFVDANILMYAAGAPHPHREPSIRFLARVVNGELDAAISSEILQEILHRYRTTGRWELGRRVYRATRTMIPEVLPITAEVLDLACALAESHPRLAARDAVHASTVKLHGLAGICSFDSDFDGIPGLVRIEP